MFLAGAPAPPWTALLTLQDRSRRQDVKGMLKYTVHEGQARAEARGPAHQVRALE